MQLDTLEIQRKYTIPTSNHELSSGAVIFAGTDEVEKGNSTPDKAEDVKNSGINEESVDEGCENKSKF